MHADFKRAVRCASWVSYEEGSIAELAEVNRIRRLVPQSVAIASVPFQYLAFHGIHDTLVRAQAVCLRAPYVSNPFPRMLHMLALKGMAYEHKRYRRKILGQDTHKASVEERKIAEVVNSITRVGSTFIHVASKTTESGNALHSVYGTYAAVSMCRPEYVCSVWKNIIQRVVSFDRPDSDTATSDVNGRGRRSGGKTTREGPFTIETVDAFAGDMMFTNVLCEAEHVDTFLIKAHGRPRGGGAQKKKHQQQGTSRFDFLHNVQVNMFRLIRIQGSSFVVKREQIFAGEVADHIMALAASPSIVIGHVNVDGRRWTLGDISGQRRVFEKTLAGAAMSQFEGSHGDYWRNDLDDFIFASTSAVTYDDVSSAKAISVLIFCLKNDDYMPVRIEYVAHLADTTNVVVDSSPRRFWSLYQLALVFPLYDDAMLWHSWFEGPDGKDRDQPLVSSPNVNLAASALVSRAREKIRTSDWLTAHKLLLFRAAVLRDFSMISSLIPMLQGPAQSLEGLHNDSIVFDAFDSAASSSRATAGATRGVLRDCQELLTRYGRRHLAPNFVLVVVVLVLVRIACFCRRKTMIMIMIMKSESGKSADTSCCQCGTPFVTYAYTSTYIYIYIFIRTFLFRMHQPLQLKPHCTRRCLTT